MTSLLLRHLWPIRAAKKCYLSVTDPAVASEDDDDLTSIVVVAELGNLKEFERLYLADPSRLKSTDLKGRTVLHAAASKNKVNVLQYALEHGAVHNLIILIYIVDCPKAFSNISNQRWDLTGFHGLMGFHGLTEFHGLTGFHMGFYKLTGFHELMGFHGLTEFHGLTGFHMGFYKLTGFHELMGFHGLTEFHGLTGFHMGFYKLTGSHDLTGFRGLTEFHGLMGFHRLTGFYRLTGFHRLKKFHGLTGFHVLSRFHVRVNEIPQVNGKVKNLNDQDHMGDTAIHVTVRHEALEALDFLIDNGADAQILNNRKQAPIHLATVLNYVRVVKQLVKHAKKLDVMQGGEHGRTALHLAAIYDFPECADVLLSELKCCPRQPCNNGFYPIHEAAKNASAKTMEVMLQRVESIGYDRTSLMLCKDLEGNDPLHSAVNGGDVKAVKLCLENGARICTQQNNLSTPVHLACSQGSLEIVKLMFTLQPEDKMEALITADVQKMTPLHCAAMFDHVDIVDYLITEVGATIDPSDKEHRTPLLLAASRGSWKTVRSLLNVGANTETRDMNNRNVFHFIVLQGGSLEEFALLMQKFHISVSDRLNEKDATGCTPMHLASRNGYFRSIDSLIKLGATINMKDNDHQSPLHFAARFGRYNTVRQLLLTDKGPFIINESNGEGQTALHIASLNGHTRVVQLLLAKGALLHRDHNGRTPFHLAAQSGFIETMDLLMCIHSHLLDQVDKDGNSALHLAAIANKAGAITYILNLEGKLLTNKAGQSPMDIVILSKYQESSLALATHNQRSEEIFNTCSKVFTSLPQALISQMPEVFMAVLDKSITRSDEKRESKNYFVKYSFKHLQLTQQYIQEKKTQDKTFKSPPLPALNTMVQNGRVELLSHPVTQQYLQMKWDSYGMYFHLANLFVYIIFLFFLTLFTCSLARLHRNDMDDKITKQCCLGLVMLPCILCYSTTKYTFLRRDSLTRVLAFGSKVGMLLILMPFNRVGIYVVMFLEILKTLLKVLLLFSILIIAFGLALYILMCKADQLTFNNAPLSLIRIFSMMLGEIDFLGSYVGPYFSDHTNKNVTQTLGKHISSPSNASLPYPEVNLGFLVIFMVFMPILLMNLLIGLAVGDIESVRRNAQLKRIAMQTMQSASSYPESPIGINGTPERAQPAVPAKADSEKHAKQRKSVLVAYEASSGFQCVELHTELERKLPQFLLNKVDKDEVVIYPNNACQSCTAVRKNNLWNFIYKYLGVGMSKPKQTILQLDNYQEEDIYFDELIKHKQKLKDITKSLEHQQQLLRLIMQKMDIKTEADDFDEGIDSKKNSLAKTYSNTWNVIHVREIKISPEEDPETEAKLLAVSTGHYRDQLTSVLFHHSDTVEVDLIYSIIRFTSLMFKKFFCVLKAVEDGNLTELEQLQHSGRLVNRYKDENGRSLLHLAAIRDKASIIDFLLSSGVDINAVDNDGNSALHAAAEYDAVESLEYLIFRNADTALKNKKRMGAIHVAAEKNSLKAIQLFVLHKDKVDILMGGENGKTVMHIAANGNFHEVAAAILSAKLRLSLTKPCDHGVPAVIEAARNAAHETLDVMLKAGKDIGYLPSDILKLVDAEGNTPLHSAVHSGDVEHEKRTEENINTNKKIQTVKMCLQHGAKITTQEHSKVTPVHLACAQGTFEILRLMFVWQPEEKAKVMLMRDLQGMTPLHCAASYNHHELVTYLIQEGADIDLKDNEGRTSLLLAASRAGWSTVQLLIRLGADVRIRDKENRNLLHLIVTHGGSLEDFSEELSKIDKQELHQLLNEQDVHGCTPLHFATRGGRIRSTESLIKLGACITTKNNDNESPLHFATRFQKSHQISSSKTGLDKTGFPVLPKMAPKTKLRKTGKITPLGKTGLGETGLGETRYHGSSTQYGRYNTVVELLSGERGSYIINETDGEGLTPLHIAAQNGHTRIVQLLLNKGALLERDFKGSTPLHLSAENGYVKTMAALLGVHAQMVNQVDKNGNTPLHLAAIHNKANAIGLLLNGECTIIKNETGFTPMDLALHYKHHEVAMAMATHDTRAKEMLEMNTTRCEEIIQNLISNMPEVFMAVLDKCIVKSHHNKEDAGNYYIRYDFQYLQYTRNIYEQMKGDNKHYDFQPLPAMNKMVEYRRLELLCHPVCQKYIQMKWNGYGMYIHTTNLAIYMVFMIFLTSYAATLMSEIRAPANYSIPLKTNNNTPRVIRQDKWGFQSTSGLFMNGLIILAFVFFNIVKEFLQFAQQKLKYLMDPMNILEWTLYISSTIMVFPVFNGEIEGYQLQSAAIAAFLSWFNFLLYLQRFDKVGIYVVMFLEILKTLVKALLIFSILFIAFGLAFFILLSHDNLIFSSLPVSFIRVFSMMLGEFDILGTFVLPIFRAHHNQKSFFPHFTLVFLVIFMILMPILLVNLLIGLAVGDIEGVRRNAQLKRIAMQVELHTELERKLPHFILQKVDKEEIIEYPNAIIHVPFKWLLPLIQKFVGGGYAGGERKMTDLNTGSADEFMYEELYKQKQRFRRFTAFDRFINEHSLFVLQEERDIEMVECAVKLINKDNAIELEKLLEVNPLLSQCRDHMDRTPIHHAASKNRYINMKDKNGDTPLHLAIRKNCLDAAKHLLEHDADTRIKNNSGNTPLHIAVAHNDLPAVELLLENSNHLDVTLPGENGRTCLHIAAIHNHHECAKLLLNVTKNYSFDKPCDNGYTPLHEAARGAATETLELMINWGERMGHSRNEMMAYIDREGNICLHSAIHGGNLK
uniref:Ion transport domain-containing protein n=1 Tax=Strigamia maritima TaxID=126957 RepID=T1JBU7_STRMM